MPVRDHVTRPGRVLMKTRSGVDWQNVKAALPDLSKEEIQILDHLIARKSTPEIARVMQQHRSMIWRKVQGLRKRAE